MSLNILWKGARDIIYEKVGPRLTSTGCLGEGGKAVDVSAGHFWIKAN